MKREFLQNLRVNDQPLPKEVIDAIMEENGRDAQAAKTWQDKYNRAVQEHQKQIAELQFGTRLDAAIVHAKGRSAKAITALLDVEALRESENQQTAIENAIAQLKKDSGYLFADDQLPPPYARGTGTQMGQQQDSPATLAGALRDKYERK